MDFCEDSNSSFFQDENIDEIFNSAYEAVQFSETLNTTIIESVDSISIDSIVNYLCYK